jgi:hypothetical protein
MESTRKYVYTIIDHDKREKPVFLKIGIAFVNRDGSYNVYLDALPVSGKLHIRDPKEPSATSVLAGEQP